MNIILTSTGFENEETLRKIKKAINKTFEKLKMLVIPSARKYEYSQEKYLKDYINLGFKKENIYFFDDSKADLYRNLSIDLLYVGGGNTFLLKSCLEKANFEKDIVKYVKHGVIYLGASAGTHIATSSIRHVEYFDKNQVGIKSFEGLNFYKGIIICHYNNNREEVSNKLKDEKKYEVETLKDNEILLYSKNGSWIKI